TLSDPPRGGDQVSVSTSSASGGPTDLAGNHVADPGTVGVTATNVAPTLDVTGGTPEAALTSNAQPPYQGSATDPDGNVMGVEASVDGGPFSGAGVSCTGCYSGAPVNSPVAWTWQVPQRLPDGAHTLAVRSVDNAGADSPAVTRTVTIDTVPPRPTGLQAAGGSSSVTATFSKPLLCPTLTPGDFSAQVGGRPALVVSIACAGATSDAVGLTLGTPVPGGDLVVVSAGRVATDRAGNHVAGSAGAVTATNVPPTLQVTSAESDISFTADPRPSWVGSATDPDGNVTRVEASLDGAPFGTGGVDCSICGVSPVGGAVNVPVTWAYHAPRLADGWHTVALRAVDNSGATSQELTRTVMVNASPPAMKAVMAAPGSRVVSVIFTKPLSCQSVDIGDFAVTVNGAPASLSVATCSGPSDPVVDLAVTHAPEGGDTVQVTLTHPVTDEAGIRSTAPASVSAPADQLSSDLP
ncbi:MAG TPA: Ig-like domain-containing protein, partial [Actinomycetota bacterium]|nr:Ig-like domain-containing protein [Actinomycetota bacterium]